MKLRIYALCVLLALLTGCGVPLTSTTVPSVEIREGQATVEAVEVVMLMSFPLQVHLQVRGYLPNPCTEIAPIDVQRDGYKFEVLIETASSSQLDCIQVIEPFEENIALDVYGLPAGDYTVQVNGVETGFTFSQDNVLGE